MKEERTLISVIIPIYNAEKFLSRCLESILLQNYDFYEVIMVDDGSTDSSESICKSYIVKDNRFRYLYQKNSGPDMARKAGTDVACGKYVMYIDADDYITEDAIEVMHEKAETTDADIVCSQIIRFNEKKDWPGSIYCENDVILKDKESILKAFFESETLIGTYYAKLIKTSIMKSYGFIKDGLIGEDITAALYMFDKAKSITVIPNKTYYYYQNIESVSHAKYSYRHEVSLKNYIKLRDRYLEKTGINVQRVCGYFAGYQMAVATAMGRSGIYESRVGENLRRDLRDHWHDIKHDLKTAQYMKLCIWLYMSTPRVFVGLFRILYLLTGR